MLQLIASRLPAPLHRLVLRLAHYIRMRWWRYRRLPVVGCRVVAVNSLGEVLLVRHSYGSRHWMLPGGGVAPGEMPIAAAIRELAEETACTLIGPIEVSVIRHDWQGVSNVVHVIAGRTGDTPRPDGREIVATRCFALTALPVDIGESLAENLSAWVSLVGSE